VNGKRSAILAAFVFGTTVPAAAQTGAPPRTTAEQKQSRYQIGVLERVLEGAVEHAVTVTRDRLQAVLPAQIQLTSENALVRGFRLDGYGLFFDVVVPSFEGTLPWVVRAFGQTDLALDSALRDLRAHIAAAGDARLAQALKRVELQVGPPTLIPAGAPRLGNTVSASALIDNPPPVDPILKDPQEAYRTEVKHALMDAMLDHSASLGLGDAEWLTVAARRNDERPRLAPADTEAGTLIIRLKGSDLSAFLARRITRDDALQRIDVRVF
jgi:hypothetical protein